MRQHAICSRLSRLAAFGLISAFALGGLTVGATASTSLNRRVSAGAQEFALGDDTLKVLGEYEIQGDELVGEVKLAHLRVWERFASLFPAATRPDVSVFVAINAAKSGGTDGAMQNFDDDPAGYYIALDVTGYSSNLDRTMIHEFFHLVTLRATEIPRDEAAIDSCPVFTPVFGCPLPDAYLTAWDEAFWPDYLIADFNAQGKKAVKRRFKQNKGSFVTEYAATNPAEDAAETFSEWVLRNKPATGDRIVDEKLRFWEAYPEVVAIRDQIRAGLEG